MHTKDDLNDGKNYIKRRRREGREIKMAALGTLYIDDDYVYNIYICAFYIYL